MPLLQRAMRRDANIRKHLKRSYSTYPRRPLGLSTKNHRYVYGIDSAIYRPASLSSLSAAHSRRSSRINAKSIRDSEDRKEHAEDNGRISCYEFSLISRRHVFRTIILFAADHTAPPRSINDFGWSKRDSVRLKFSSLKRVMCHMCHWNLYNIFNRYVYN